MTILVIRVSRDYSVHYPYNEYKIRAKYSLQFFVVRQTDTKKIETNLKLYLDFGFSEENFKFIYLYLMFIVLNK